MQALPRLLPLSAIGLSLSAETARLHERIWKPGYGSISAIEAEFIKHVIDVVDAARFVEIGTATGLSGVFIIQALEGRKGAEFYSVDTAHQFWNDLEKPTGFLIEQECASSSIPVHLVRGRSSLDTETVISGSPVDSMFIDANHQHPWPLIDTILNLPFVREGGAMIHHDLELYKKQEVVRGIGPKYLYDQLPDNLKIFSPQSPNIFAFGIPANAAELDASLSNGFLLPWSCVQPVDPALVAFLESFCARHYDKPEIVENFKVAMNRFNK